MQEHQSLIKAQSDAIAKKREETKRILEEQIIERQKKLKLEKELAKEKYKTNLGPEECDDHY